MRRDRHRNGHLILDRGLDLGGFPVRSLDRCVGRKEQMQVDPDADAAVPVPVDVKRSAVSDSCVSNFWQSETAVVDDSQKPKA